MVGEFYGASTPHRPPGRGVQHQGLFADDAEYVNIFGQRMGRRDGIAAGHQVVFASLLAGSRFTVTGTDVMPLGQDAALMHATWRRDRLPGATPATLPAGTGIFTFVARRAGDAWLLAGATNVQDAAPPPAPAC